MGFWLIRLAGAYDIEARTIDSLNPNYLFSDIEGGYGLAFGYPAGVGWSLGAGIKGLYHDLDLEDARGLGVDAAARWEGLDGWRLGLVLHDAYSTLLWSTGEQEIFPPVLKAGLAYVWQFLPEQNALFSAEGEYFPGQSRVRWHGGVEYAFNQVIFIRAGFDDNALAGGGGLYLPWIGWAKASLELQYALTQDRISGWDHWMTLGLKF